MFYIDLIILFFPVKCSKDHRCAYWTFVSNFQTKNFNCTLLSSCKERKVYAYPDKTSSGDRECIPEKEEKEKRRKCRPACKGHAPFCHGRCYFFRLCLYGPCSPNPFREDIGDTCSQLAMEAAEGSCRTNCSGMVHHPEATHCQCQDCIKQNLTLQMDNDLTGASQCFNMSGSECWSCSTPVSENLRLCSENSGTALEIIQCVKRNLELASPSFSSSSTRASSSSAHTNLNNQCSRSFEGCKSCICTLICYWSAESDLCKSCIDETQLRTLSINHNHCPQGWTWAAETSKCYKAFPDKRPWPHADAFCKKGNGNLAQPMYNSSWFAIIESINIRTEAKGNFWIGSRFSDQGYIWVNGSYNSYKNWEEEGGPISGNI